MKNHFQNAGCGLLVGFIFLFLSSSYGEEGMWLPNAIPETIIQEMQAKGLELTLEELVNENGTGVVNAVVSLGGGTGSFVSPQGLIITNHHVAYGAVQRISTANQNYIESGFLARTPAAELPAHGYNAYVLLAIEEITPKVLKAVQPGMSPIERYKAIEKVSKEIIKQAEADKDVYCSVSDFFNGAQYYLMTYKRIKDMRIVYVPARAIGEFGGDIDNWMWPRHTGDFSFLRAYVAPDGKSAEYAKENVPYQHKSYLKIAAQGLQPGDFALIAGYPGNTQRYMTSFSIDLQQNYRLPWRIQTYDRWIKILEAASKNEPDATVKVIGSIKGLNNGMKYYQGLLDGFLKFNLLKQKQQIEEDFLAFLERDATANAKYSGVLPRLKTIIDEYKTFWLKNEVLNSLYRLRLLSNAALLYKWSLEKQKDDLERDPGYMNRRVPDLKEKLELAQKSLHPASEREVMRMLLKMAAKLPAEQRIQGLEAWLAEKDSLQLEKSIAQLLDQLYTRTRLTETEVRLKMFEMSHQELLQQDDAFIDLAQKLHPEKEASTERYQTYEGALSEIMPQWIDGLRYWKEGVLYPDANGTLRLNYGIVKGYSPRDAVNYYPFTTLKGVIEKDSGQAPFDVPQKLKVLYQKKDFGDYSDPQLQDVPVDLLTTNDSTGGNSGSPLMNGQGELVGVLFDGNYEAMSADYEFDVDLARSIHVDIRFVLFVADKVDQAQELLQELGIK